MPFLPIFVFDGPKRPKIKRGRAVGGKEHWMVNNLRTVLDAFGFECRTAPGEAEAELAYLNRIGVIDAVLSDDVDCFLFGAHTVIRNSSATLSGNRSHGARNTDGKEDGQHAYLYRLKDIMSHCAVNLSPGGLILIALLRGGDYDQVLIYLSYRGPALIRYAKARYRWVRSNHCACPCACRIW
jgi:holliday junction resolvase GEN1/YEN1